jgi:predicted nucleic acid-binding protein
VAEIILVDSDVLIDVGREVEEAISCLDSIERHSSPAISAVTQMELIVGCRTKTELRKLDRFLLRFQVVPISETISDRSVDLLHRYRLSHGLLIADAIIAGTALTLGSPFVTKNQRDYRFIDKLQLLPYPQPFST